MRIRRGYSLAELLVAIVLVGIIGGALSKMVIEQMRFFDSVDVARGARSVARNSMNVLLADLRMVEDSGGVSSISGDNRTIAVRVPYRFGLFCGNNGTTSTISMLPVDSATSVMAVRNGYGYRGRTSGRYTMVAGGTLVASTTPTRCTGTGTGEAGIATITVNGRAGNIYDITSTSIPATLALGSPVLFYQTITYSFAASSMFSGKYGLWRSITGGVNEELMAPFTSGARFRYYAVGDDTSRVVAPALSELRGIALVLTSEGSRKPAGRTAASESRMFTSVFFKNVR